MADGTYDPIPAAASVELFFILEPDDKEYPDIDNLITVTSLQYEFGFEPPQGQTQFEIVKFENPEFDADFVGEQKLPEFLFAAKINASHFLAKNDKFPMPRGR